MLQIPNDINLWEKDLKWKNYKTIFKISNIWTHEFNHVKEFTAFTKTHDNLRKQ
jgi:hypothetical protein